MLDDRSDWKTIIEERVTALELSHHNLRVELQANTRMTSAVKADTGSLVEFANALKGFVTFCRWIGRGLKWTARYIAPVVMAAVAVWAILTGKKTP